MSVLPWKTNSGEVHGGALRPVQPVDRVAAEGEAASALGVDHGHVVDVEPVVLDGNVVVHRVRR
jgi:hypothetical protein